jgi:hypothetical protein
MSRGGEADGDEDSDGTGNRLYVKDLSRLTDIESLLKESRIGPAADWHFRVFAIGQGAQPMVCKSHGS